MKRTLWTSLGVLLFAFVALVWPAAGDPDNWVLLGERHVSDRLEHDSIAVTAARGDFEKLQVRVYGRAVQFRDMKVHFANGETQDVALRDVIRAGGASRVIDLSGGDRVIRSIEFWYDAQTVRRGRGAQIKVFGRH